MRGTLHGGGLIAGVCQLLRCESIMPDTAPHYSAVIRAHEVSPLLAEVIGALRAQTAPPEQVIIVDSSHDPVVTAQFQILCDHVVPYPNAEFNYSRALNLGIAANRAPLTLALSSHVMLDDPGLIARGWTKAQARGLDIVFWTRADTPEDDRSFPISRGNFNGRNGIGNSSAMIPTELLLARPFREEVFSAEDQEWTRYYLRTHQRAVLRVQTMGLRYLNPNHGEQVWSHTKLLNEELAIGHFVRRRLIMPDRILARVARGVLAWLRGRRDRARLHFGIARAMVSANFVPPKRQSRYF